MTDRQIASCPISLSGRFKVAFQDHRRGSDLRRHQADLACKSCSNQPAARRNIRSRTWTAYMVSGPAAWVTTSPMVGKRVQSASAASPHR